MLSRDVSGARSYRDRTPSVGPAVDASWRAHREFGLRSDCFDLPRKDLPDAAGPLVRASTALLDGLCRELHGSGVAMVLSDDDATVVARRCPDEVSLRRLDDARLAPGFVWRLDTAGTNAIGIASQQRAPAIVDGREHFMDAAKTLTTASAPICDERSGQLLGAFTLVCEADAANPLLLPVARHGARDIEQTLLDRWSVHERVLTAAFLRARRRARGPLVLVADRILLRNAAAARLFGEPDGPSLWKTAARAADGGEPTPTTFVSRRGDCVVGSVEPLRDSEGLIGALIHFGATGTTPRPQERPIFGRESLTETELAVADLIAKGLTNREVAVRLFLSHHTVDTHLRHIFHKLNINSRIELARVVEAASRPPRPPDEPSA